MKNIFFLIAMVLGVTSYAQPILPSFDNYQNLTMTQMNAAGTTGKDTTLVGGADTTYLTWHITGSCNQTAFCTFTKISGTVGGTGLLQGSATGGLTGTWYTLSTDNTGIITSQFVTDTATITNATNTYAYNIRSRFKYYRFRIITSAGKATLSGTVYYRRNDY